MCVCPLFTVLLKMIFLDTLQDPYTNGECYVTDLSDFNRFTNSTQHSMGKKFYDILVHRKIEKQSMLSGLIMLTGLKTGTTHFYTIHIPLFNTLHTLPVLFSF